MLVQVVARKISGLPITLLEINTITHVGCAIAIYTIWCYKPQGLSEQVIIDTTACTTREQYLRSCGIFDSDLRTEVLIIGDSGSFWGPPGSRSLLLMGINLVYGGIHAFAWNAHFPSIVEENFWRASGCAIAFVAVTLGLFLYSGTARPYVKLIIELPFFFLLALYIVARLFFIVEAFISVRALPLGAYDTVQWSNALPHIG